MKVQEIVRAAKQLASVEAEPPEELWGKIRARLEVWRVIEGFEAYEVSNMGRVRRAVDGKGGRGGAKAGTLVHPAVSKTGYLHLTLFKQSKKHNKYLHRLVAQAFIPNPNNLPEVNHKGKSKAD